MFKDVSGNNLHVSDIHKTLEVKSSPHIEELKKIKAEIAAKEAEKQAIIDDKLKDFKKILEDTRIRVAEAKAKENEALREAAEKRADEARYYAEKDITLEIWKKNVDDILDIQLKQIEKDKIVRDKEMQEIDT